MEKLPEEFFESVVAAYHSSGCSIREAAIKMDISRTKVRKILITMGEIKSDITEKALPLLAEGKQQKEVADILGVSVATLSTYLPYGNRVFNREDKTEEAIRTEEYRERQKLAASKQVNNVNEKKNKIEVKTMGKNTDKVKVLKLKLELKMDEDDRDVVRKYGKAKKGISREFIVPYYYPLHALHYAIQKAFGWQNCHLHHFELPDNVFNNLTNDSFMNYCMLCGLIFRFPYSDEDMDDVYWDDDYSEGKSFKTWLRNKYTAPYDYCGMMEHFIFSQVNAKSFWDTHQTVRIGPSFAEYLKGKSGIKDVKLPSATCEEMDRFFEHNFGEVIERVPINDVLCQNPEDTACEECNKIADELDGKFGAAFRELQRLYSVFEKLDAAKKKRNISEVQELQEEYDNSYDALVNRTNVSMPPVSNELIYKYDYGDNWEVKITCEAEYVGDVESGNVIRFYSTDGTPADKELSDLIFKQCIIDGNPICIAADGLPVMDDVGGVSGYCDFLKCIKTGEEGGMYDDPEDSKDWARSMGWTGRMSKPENIL